MSRIVLASLVIGVVLGGMAERVVGQPQPTLEIEAMTSIPVSDCDGIALGDINSDGRVDLLTSSGSEGSVFWFEQTDDPAEWRRHVIHKGAVEIEGNDLADFDGDGRLEAISLDQKAGKVLLHHPREGPREGWQTTVIESDRLFLQASLTSDIDEDGRPELVYTWEGAEPGMGGVHWLDFAGETVADPGAWTDYAMVRHESAWWLGPRLIDLNGDGRATEILYTARNLTDRNAAARPGLFWVEPGDDPTTPWTQHSVDTTLAHPLHVDVGSFSSATEDQDIVVGGFDTNQVQYYVRADSMQRRALSLPRIRGESFNEIWNVKALPIADDPRDAILTVVSRPSGSAMVLYEPRAGAYQSRVVMTMAYTHPMDDRMVLYDLIGQKGIELIVPDSGGDKLSIFRIREATGTQ